MPTCVQCGKRFEAERSTAKFCDERCRQLTHRQMKVAANLMENGLDKERAMKFARALHRGRPAHG